MDKKRFVRDPLKVRSPLPKQVGFKFKKEVSENERKAILRKTRSWKEVRSVEQVFKNTDMDLSDHMMGLYILFVKNNAQIELVLKKLQAISEIEYAYVPSGRSWR